MIILILRLRAGKLGSRLTAIPTLVSVIRITTGNPTGIPTGSSVCSPVCICTAAITQARVHALTIVAYPAVEASIGTLKTIALAALLSIASMLNFMVIDKGNLLTMTETHKIS